MKRFAVIPTGNRPDEYSAVANWCKENGVTTVTIATSDQANGYSIGKTINDRSKNISAWWSLGLEYVADKMFDNDEDYIVAVLNDDITLPEGWIEIMENAIKEGYSGASGGRNNNPSKASGYAFCLNGRHDIRPDTDLAWYYTEDAIVKRCEEEQGFKVISDLRVPNKYEYTSEAMFSEQIKKDTVTFKRKYGER